MDNEIIDKLFEDDEIKAAIEEYVALQLAEALEAYRKKAEKKFGKQKGKKNVPDQPECFGVYKKDETPPECRSCTFAQDCKVKSKVKKETKKNK